MPREQVSGLRFADDLAAGADVSVVQVEPQRTELSFHSSFFDMERISEVKKM
jgi:hypothetical protein